MKKLLFVIATFFTLCLDVQISKAFHVKQTSEIRAYIQDIDCIKTILLDLGAEYQSEYVFTDYMYQSKDGHWNLDEQFVRLRVYEKTMWDQKRCVLVHKKKTILGVTGNILIHKEFDAIEDAKQDLDEYTLLFSFYRKGWQYSLNGMQIFVEDIENLNPTIEIVASDKDQIDDVFTKLAVKDVMKYSIPYTIQEKIAKKSF